MLLLLLCAVSVASVRNFTQGTIEKNRSLDTRSALQFTPRQIDVRVGQTLHCCAVAIIPLGYDNLYFEEKKTSFIARLFVFISLAIPKDSHNP